MVASQPTEEEKVRVKFEAAAFLCPIGMLMVIIVDITIIRDYDVYTHTNLS